MYYATGTHIKNNAYGNGRKLERTDGFFPTNTMLLHQRIIGWHRKRRIPVKDADQASELNAYLIDPKYLENREAVLPKELPEPQPKAHIPVYQYSKITHNTPVNTPHFLELLIQTAVRSTQTLKIGIAALAAELAARYRKLLHPRPATHYAVSSGASLGLKQRIKLFAATVLMGSLLIAALSLDNSDKIKPTPVSANPNPGHTSSSSTSSPSHSSVASTPSGANQTSSDSSGQTTPTTLSTPRQQPITYQQPLSNATTTSPIVSSPTTASSGTTSTTTTPPTSPIQVPQSNITQPLDPILTPVTGLVNDVLSTQITVNNPLSDTTQPLVQISK